MVESTDLVGTKKRRILASSLAGKFRSKTDFMKFFTGSCQLYVPPEKYINKDFLKQVLAEEKHLLPNDEVKTVSVPLYDELSVKKFYPMFQADKEVMRYLPDPTPDGRLPDRKYFFNILNTLKPDYMKKVIEHANNQRMTAFSGLKETQTIEVSDEWWRKLDSIPFVSCK